MPYIGKEPVRGQNRELDDISGSFNGSNTAFTMQVGGINTSAGSVNQLFISVGGVMQNPGTDFTVAASTLTFTTAPPDGASFWGLIQGDAVDINTPADDSVNEAKLVVNSPTNGHVLTADATTGGGMKWAAAAGTTINNNADNRVITGSGTANTLEAESTLTYDGTHLSISNGNLVIGTAGKGIDFSANTSASTTGSTMSSELLDWYEEGTWTPSITFGNTSDFSGGSMGAVGATYTRIGRIVTANFDAVISAKGSSSGLVHVNGLPFQSGGSAHRCGTCLAFNTWMDTDQKCSRTRMYLGDSRTYLQLLWNSLDNLNNSDCNASGQICGIVTYQVP